MIKILALAVLLSLQSCMLWDVLKPSGGINTDVEIVAGDKENHAEVNANKETTHNTAYAITQTYNTVNEQYPWWVMALLILGWVLPSPSHMWKNIVNLFRRKKNA